MNRFPFFFVIVTFFFDGAVAQELPDHVAQVKQGTALFQKSVRGALVENCLECHGGEKIRSGFDLSTRESLLKGGDSGEVVDLKDPGSSYLLALIRHEDEPTMPPAKDKLDEKVLSDISTWLALGAPYDKPLVEQVGASRSKALQVTESDRQFWSFLPLQNPTPPATQNAWPKTDIDRFILQGLEENGLSPNSSVSNLARIRRAYLDVIGLPPTIEQLTHALSMSHSELVDTLLNSPHYGERWARHWLDVARFAESHGFEQDYDRKYAYHYRDFVIKALNADMPWDQFVQWQLAGDELAPENPLALMATGFLGAGVFPTQLTEKEFESARYDELDDMAATVGTAMLGLTIGCARCHDHKFDPIPVNDYYRFVSTFTTTIRSEVDVTLDPAGYELKLERWQDTHASLVSELANYQASDEFQEKFKSWLESTPGEELLAEEWTHLVSRNVTSNSKSTKFELQDDGSLLAVGKAAAKEIYTLGFDVPKAPIQYLRIEALTHSSMQRSGPGRASNGNFALSDIKVFAKTSSEKRRLSLVSAKATHEQNSGNLSAASAIDEDDSKTGWAVDFGGIGEDQAAVFELEQVLLPESYDELEIQLVFKNNTQHSLGRFRLSSSRNASPMVRVGGGITSELREAILALRSGTLADEQTALLKQRFELSDETSLSLKSAMDKSLDQKPTPNQVKVQVSSEGLPPTKHHADGRGFPHFYEQTFHLTRGDPNQKGDIAEPGFLRVLMRNGKSLSDWSVSAPEGWSRTSFRRASLANWITDEENGAGHLLARVIVNRLWHHHFGQGIVATPNDFGLQGKQPTHPELLDYLATKLIANDWKLKEIHREILESATWLQSKDRVAANEQADPENTLLWKYPTRRLEAEVVRDSILFASGQLEPRMFGPGSLDAKQKRRSIYFMIKRSRLIPFMQIFDQPEPLSSQGSRPSTTIAPQALLFLNNPQVVDWAASFGSSLVKLEDKEAIRQLYLRTLTREPTEAELITNQEFVSAQSASYSGAINARELALADLCQVVFGLNEFIYMP